MAKFDISIYNDLIHRYSSLFLDESSKDVTFIFEGSEETIKAHKMILKVASPVFKSMFSGSFAEKDEVKIDDISPEVFKLFLSGIYLNDIHPQVKSDLPSETYAELYYAAEKYDIKDIRELSKKFMIDNCHYGVTHLLLKRAKLLNLPDLEAKCKDYFQENAYIVLGTHIRLTLNDGYFHEFFDMENIPVKTELDLYMALQAMVHNGVLLDYSKCLSKIRFLTMNTIDVLSCKLLSAEDKVSVIANIEAKKLQEAPKFVMPEHLSVENKPRKFVPVKGSLRRSFWTALMLKSVKYEDYYEDFFKQMEISADSKERTKALINEGRNEKNEEGCITNNVVNKTKNKIFYNL